VYAAGGNLFSGLDVFTVADVLEAAEKLGSTITNEELNTFLDE